MNPFPIARRRLAPLLAAFPLLFAACGGSGGGDGDAARLRLLNLSSDVSSVDVDLDADTAFADVPSDAITDYEDVDAGSHAVEVRAHGSGTALLDGTWSLSSGTHYTGVVWGRSGGLKYAMLSEDADTDDLDDGDGGLRVFNATTDTGALDVYLTPETASLADAVATASSVAAATVGGYKGVAAGTYRLRVTSAGNADEVRLDVSNVAVAEGEYATLILTAGSGGVLVDGALLAQTGTLTLLKNNQARLRVVAGAGSRGNVAVSLDGTPLASLRSPAVGSYQLVGAGSRVVDVAVDGTSRGSTTRTLQAGGDYTLLTSGDGSAAQVALIADDNRLTTTSGRYRVRLVNGVAGLDPIALTVDYAELIAQVASGTASAFTTASASESARIDVGSASADAPLFTVEEANLQAYGVYTVFLLGGNAMPTGVLRKDR